MVEWGQYIVAPAQITIYKVISEKIIPKANAKAWYIIDGSFMNDLKDTWAIHQKWHTIPANNMHGALRPHGLPAVPAIRMINTPPEAIIFFCRNFTRSRPICCNFRYRSIPRRAFFTPLSYLSAPMKIVAQTALSNIARKRETADSIGKLFGWNGAP